jgi:thiol-disulfide isomerase/thioredoxin
MSEFIEATDADFEEKLKGVPVAIIDYYASWCGSCRMAAPMFKRVANELALPIFKIDAEKNETARSLVEIENLPTLAIWKDGKIIGSLCTTKEEALKELLKSHNIMGDK